MVRISSSIKPESEELTRPLALKAETIRQHDLQTKSFLLETSQFIQRIKLGSGQTIVLVLIMVQD